MSGLYSINSAERLFEKLIRDFTEFDREPTIDRLFNVLFSLYHLREWICPVRHKLYMDKLHDQRTPEEQLAARLYGMPDYKILADLCNHAKHLDPDLGARTEVLEGLRMGLGRCGDSLGVTHFLVDNREIRDIFWSVYVEYFDYFRPGVRQLQIDAPAAG